MIREADHGPLLPSLGDGVPHRQGVRPLPEPLAPDGVEFRRAVLDAASAIARCRPGGYATPSEVRALVERQGVKPPHPNHWGSAWNDLKRAGWVHSTERETSRTASRNASAEERWIAPFARSST